MHLKLPCCFCCLNLNLSTKLSREITNFQIFYMTRFGIEPQSPVLIAHRDPDRPACIAFTKTFSKVFRVKRLL